MKNNSTIRKKGKGEKKLGAARVKELKDEPEREREGGGCAIQHLFCVPTRHPAGTSGFLILILW